MEQDLQKKLQSLEQKIDAVYKSVKRIQLYFLITTIVTVAAIVLPLVGLLFVIPQFLSTISSATNITNF